MSNYFTASTTLTSVTVTLTSLLVAPLLVYLLTSLLFQIRFRNFVDPASQFNKDAIPPQLPYALPWIGNAVSFLSTTPHKFWVTLFSWYPRTAGAIQILLGGNKTTVIFNTSSAQYIMRDRKLGRDSFNEQVVMNGFSMSKSECDKFYEHGKKSGKGDRLPGHAEADRINLEYMLKTERVNELTTQFVENFRKEIGDQFNTGSQSICLYSWVRTLMFNASTIALSGSRIMEVVPDLEKHFFAFDADMLSLFFGLPRWMIREKHVNRDATMDLFEKWYDSIEEELGGKIPDPETVAWEPCLGSRIIRARHAFYRRQGITRRSMAGLDLGMLFAIASNAVPATGWMLMYIVDSMRPEKKVPGEPTLYEHVMAELKEVQNSDGSLNVSALVNQPVLLSLLHEVLRCYVDVMVSRLIPQDMYLPLPLSGTNKDVDVGNNGSASRSIFLKAGEILMVPTWPAHNNAEAWSSPEFPHHPSPDVFYPYRFLTAPPTAKSSDKPIFTTSHTAGSFFPFGGGKTMCPGRTFAKQEIMAGVAMVLLTFDIEYENYTDAKGRPSQSFPGLRDTLPGSAVMVASGDLKVRVSRR